MRVEGVRTMEQLFLPLGGSLPREHTQSHTWAASLCAGCVEDAVVDKAAHA